MAWKEVLGSVAGSLKGEDKGSSSIPGAVSAIKKWRDKRERKRTVEETEPAGGVASFRRGGPVRKTGLALLHKGEHILTKRQSKEFHKRLRKE